MQLSSGVKPGCQKVIVYGTEGIGKSTLASKFPMPVFIDIEGGTKQLDVRRIDGLRSWSMLMESVSYCMTIPDKCSTIVIDTADWAERLCVDHVCASQKNKKGDAVTSLEGFGYGKGYTFLYEEFGRLLDLLSIAVERGQHVVLVAHAVMRKFEQPEELGAYDRWELKLKSKSNNSVAAMIKEWADCLLFCNYKTRSVEHDGKHKAQGGGRIMYTTHHACWDAKNRYGLPEELEMDYSTIAHCFIIPEVTPVPIEPEPAPVPASPTVAEKETVAPPPEPIPAPEQPVLEPDPLDEFEQKLEPDDGGSQLTWRDMFPALAELMDANKITPDQIREVVAKKKYYTLDTPIENYAPDFVSGCLVAAWPQVKAMIDESFDGLPF
ncbi:MAG: ATP-binding protein [Oscillospiraceae bacterium]|jgi:hypothetical protein|nr:ATP-binding protein [Oscillospiraceae bacterium]